MKKLLFILPPLLIALLVVAWTYYVRGKTPPNNNALAPTIANPASVNCVDKGGKVSIINGPKGEYGVCIFDDNRQCEEWAMYKGDCPVGGVKITGYTTQQARYCEIIGGDYVETDNTCHKGTLTCPVKKLYSGDCVLKKSEFTE